MSENPWSKRWRGLHAAQREPAERVLAEIEARDAESRDVMVCGKCGCDAHYRPGVGAYQCSWCRAVYRARDDIWV